MNHITPILLVLFAQLVCLAECLQGQPTEAAWSGRRPTTQQVRNTHFGANPLRQQSFDTEQNQRVMQASPTPQSVRLVAEPQSDLATSRLHDGNRPTEIDHAPRQDFNVQPASHNQTSLNDSFQGRLDQRQTYTSGVLPTPRVSGGQLPQPQASAKPQQNFLERMKTDTSKTSPSNQEKQPHLGEIIARLGMNLAIVLGVCLCAILVIKHFFIPEAKKEDTSEPANGFTILESLKVTDQATLRVIEYQDTTILLATDNEGIKSVQILERRFEDLIQNDAERESSREETESTREGLANTYSSSTISQKPIGSSSGSVDENVLSLLLQNASRPRAA